MTAFKQQSVCIDRDDVPLSSDARVGPQERAERRYSVEVCFHAQLVLCVCCDRSSGLKLLSF